VAASTACAGWAPHERSCTTCTCPRDSLPCNPLVAAGQMRLACQPTMIRLRRSARHITTEPAMNGDGRGGAASHPGLKIHRLHRNDLYKSELFTKLQCDAQESLKGS
jgi:hypothetical protein